MRQPDPAAGDDLVEEPRRSRVTRHGARYHRAHSSVECNTILDATIVDDSHPEAASRTAWHDVDASTE